MIKIACKIWNTLPESIRTASTLSGFKRLAKKKAPLGTIADYYIN